LQRDPFDAACLQHDPLNDCQDVVMRLTASLNDRQLQVLRWIADGCPSGVMTGHGHKGTARALQDRRLVKISKRDDVWSAEMTATGTYYLKHGEFPPKGTALPKAPKTSQSERSKPAKRSANTVHPETSATTRPKKLSSTEKLVADVIAAGGTLRVEPNSIPGRDAAWELAKLARQANRAGKTPPGKRLVRKIVHEGDHWNSPRHNLIVLEDGPAGTDAPLMPVTVPEKVSRYHPAVSALRNANRLDMAAASRAARILHAVATEAEHREFTASAHMPRTNDSHHRETWHLLLVHGEETVPLRISEETDRVDHIATAKELADKARYSWTRVPTYDHVPSGRLRIDLGGAVQTERRSFWADRASWTLEEKLPELLREVAVRAEELRLRRVEKTRAKATHEEAVEQERQRARVRAAEADRLELLKSQLERWREVRELREYAAALEDTIVAAINGGADEQAITNAQRWVTWLSGLADGLDPTHRLPTWPKPPELRGYELQKFMNRVPEPDAMRYRPEAY
jgi:hypothetical protein